jgi:hypothetical protein
LSPLDLVIHLLSFAAPALAVAVLVTLAARLVLQGQAGWWRSLACNLAAGLLVLAAGLWWFGRDGKMVTYAALVIVVASCQWLVGRAWRS